MKVEVILVKILLRSTLQMNSGGPERYQNVQLSTFVHTLKEKRTERPLDRQTEMLPLILICMTLEMFFAKQKRKINENRNKA